MNLKLFIVSATLGFHAVAHAGASEDSLHCQSASGRTKIDLQEEGKSIEKVTIQVDGSWYSLPSPQSQSFMDRGLTDHVLTMNAEVGGALNLGNYSVDVLSENRTFHFFDLYAMPNSIRRSDLTYAFEAKLVATDPRPLNSPEKSNPGVLETPETEINCQLIYGGI